MVWLTTLKVCPVCGLVDAVGVGFFQFGVVDTELSGMVSFEVLFEFEGDDALLGLPPHNLP
jgi:hypothetical protein